jgi:hypothetical protein
MDRWYLKIRSLRAAVLLGLSLWYLALVLAGCTSVNDIPPSEEAVLQGMREVGFKFDSTLVKVIGEESKTRAKVTGPMIGPKVIPALGSEVPVKGNDNYARYKEVELEMRDGSWMVVKEILKEER